MTGQNSITPAVYSRLLPKVISLAHQAGRAAQQIYDSHDLGLSYKADHSPLTRADLTANQIIVDGLGHLTPDWLILSEESDNLKVRQRLAARQLWLVDPIDGTKGFVAGLPDYTVNIGLAMDGRPVLGVVYAPAHSLMYWGAEMVGAWKQLVPPDGSLRQAPVAQPLQLNSATDPLVVAARTNQPGPALRVFLNRLGPHQLIALGSSLKICYVADGTASLYPRLVTCMEWDTAAADAILRAAGGVILQLDDNHQATTPLVYNKTDLHNPSFVAKGLF
jgi:3'(2'), 5'-bisphosphate nucleotidase